jgi:hypothetical protein
MLPTIAWQHPNSSRPDPEQPDGAFIATAIDDDRVLFAKVAKIHSGSLAPGAPRRRQSYSHTPSVNSQRSFPSYVRRPGLVAGNAVAPDIAARTESIAVGSCGWGVGGVTGAGVGRMVPFQVCRRRNW